jgi:hypothetical protein
MLACWGTDKAKRRLYANRLHFACQAAPVPRPA